MSFKKLTYLKKKYILGTLSLALILFFSAETFSLTLELEQLKDLTTGKQNFNPYLKHINPYEFDNSEWKQLHFLKGYYTVKQKRYIAASNAFAEVFRCELTPNESEWVAFWLGLSLSESQQYDYIKYIFQYEDDLSWGQFWYADYLFKHYDIQGSITFLEKLLARTEIHALLKLKGRYLLGLCYSELGDYNKATDIFLEGTKEFPNSVLEGELLYNLGLIKYKVNARNSAIHYLEKAVDFYNRSKRKEAHWWIDEALFLLGIVYYKSENYEKSIDSFTKLRELGLNSYKKDIEYYENIISLITDYNTNSNINSIDSLKGNYASDFYFRLGYTQYVKEDYDSALSYYLKSLDKCSDPKLKEELLFFIAESYYTLRDYNQAEKYYKLALDLANRYVIDINYGLGWSLYRQAKYSQAKKCFDVVKKSERRGFTEYAAFLYAKSYYLSKDYKKAVSSFTSYLDNYSKPKYGDEAQYLIARSWKRLESFDKAAEAFLRLSYNYPKSKYAHSSLIEATELYFNESSYDKVVEIADSLDRFNLVQDDMDRVYLLAERARLKRGEYENPIEMSERFVQKHPDSPYSNKILFELGEALINNKEYEEAIYVYNTILKQDYSDSLWGEAIYYLSICYLDVGDISAAEENITTLFGEIPDHPKAPIGLLLLGNWYNKEGKNDKSLSYYQKIVKYYSGSLQKLDALYGIGSIYIGQGKYDEGREFYRQVLSESNESYSNAYIEDSLYIDNEAFLDIILSYFKEGRIEDGVQYAKENQEKYLGENKYMVLKLIGDGYAELGMNDESIDYYKTSLKEEQFPLEEKPYLMLKLGDILLKENRLVEACQLFGEIVEISNEDSLVAEARGKLDRCKAHEIE
ncbi:tetratricopeptide repeat protein [bacterium]|nr:tetratricopeptide repeat protein [bacterium]